MKKMDKIPTFEECLEIVKNNETFTHRVRIVDGYEVSVFDYMLAQFKDFQKSTLMCEMQDFFWGISSAIQSPNHTSSADA